MAYTSADLVKDVLGTIFLTADLPDADITAYIVQGDSIIDAASYEHYNAFNAFDSSKTDTTDTYVTPGLIGLAARNLAAAEGMRQLKAVKNNTAHADAIDRFEEAASTTLTLLEIGKFVQLNKWRSFSLTFGDSGNGWELSADQSFINPTALDSSDPPHILLDTLEVTTATGIDTPCPNRTVRRLRTAKWSNTR